MTLQWLQWFSKLIAKSVAKFVSFAFIIYTLKAPTDFDFDNCCFFLFFLHYYLLMK